MNLLEKCIKVGNTKTCKNCGSDKKHCSGRCIGKPFMSGMYWTPKIKTT